MREKRSPERTYPASVRNGYASAVDRYPFPLDVLLPISRRINNLDTVSIVSIGVQDTPSRGSFDGETDLPHYSLSSKYTQIYIIPLLLIPY